jgi:hypothetical protein
VATFISITQASTKEIRTVVTDDGVFIENLDRGFHLRATAFYEFDLHCALIDLSRNP